MRTPCRCASRIRWKHGRPSRACRGATGVARIARRRPPHRDAHRAGELGGGRGTGSSQQRHRARERDRRPAAGRGGAARASERPARSLSRPRRGAPAGSRGCGRGRPLGAANRARPATYWRARYTSLREGRGEVEPEKLKTIRQSWRTRLLSRPRRGFGCFDRQRDNMVLVSTLLSAHKCNVDDDISRPAPVAIYGPVGSGAPVSAISWVVASRAFTATAATRPVTMIPEKPMTSASTRDAPCRGVRSP
jgi:hypothetical protein